MITNKGKSIIARALANQVDSPFSYIALGVGAQPATTLSIDERTAAEFTSANPTLSDGEWGYETDTLLAKLGDGATAWNSLTYSPVGIQWEPIEYLTKTNLDFEAFRIPVSAASVVYEGGKTKILLTGSLPSAQRYEFSEVGVYSAEANSLLTSEPPRMIFTFSEGEGWEYHSTTSADVPYIGSISTNGFDIDSIVAGSEKAFFIGSDDPVFFTTDRKNQRVRIYKDALMLRGDLSTINTGTTPWTTGGDHIHVTAKPVNLANARPDDDIKLTFALLNSTYALISTKPADSVKFVVKFMSSEDATEYAAMQVQVTNGETVATGLQSPATTDFVNNGYYTITAPKSTLYTTAGFAWETVTVAQVFVEADPASATAASEYYISIDAIRFDSNNDNNPGYGLASYTVVQNAWGETEQKDDLSESQITIKLSLDDV